jgi:hypothetical protein
VSSFSPNRVTAKHATGTPLGGSVPCRAIAFSFPWTDASPTIRRVVQALDHQHRRLRAVIGHATSCWTRRSLRTGQGLSDQEAVQVTTAAVLAVTSVPQTEPA